MNIATLRRPGHREARVSIDAVGSMVAGTIEGLGPDTAGFARGDRVAFPLPIGGVPENDSLVLSIDTLVGVPRGVAEQQAADLLVPGIVARALLRQLRPMGDGDRIHLAFDGELLRAVVEAWVLARGGILVDSAADADIVYDETARQLAVREASLRQGRMQEAAADVFMTMRAGVFDDITVPRRGAHTIAA
ncbi:MAG TPA: hypothetical protein PK781_02350 [Terrimesophilobacter sp.]|nr:hypothetical protein [Terrimesophilobacter sp.]